MPKQRKKNVNSPFTDAQENWMILEYGAVRSFVQVRRNFMKKYPSIEKYNIPGVISFQRIIHKFVAEIDAPPGTSSGSSGSGRKASVMTPDLVQKVKSFVDDSCEKGISISSTTIASKFDISFSTAYTILKKKLGYKPYKPKTVVELTNRHKDNRVSFCQWLLQQDLNFPEFCLWSDEKWFVLKQRPNKQNERYWAPVDPDVKVQCNVQGGEKVMAWCGLIMGKIIIHWFESGTSVNGFNYLQMLKNVVWPKIRSHVNSKNLYFQQDGAPPLE